MNTVDGLAVMLKLRGGIERLRDEDTQVYHIISWSVHTLINSIYLYNTKSSTPGSTTPDLATSSPAAASPQHHHHPSPSTPSAVIPPASPQR